MLLASGFLMSPSTFLMAALAQQVELSSINRKFAFLIPKIMNNKLPHIQIEPFIAICYVKDSLFPK